MIGFTKITFTKRIDRCEVQIHSSIGSEPGYHGGVVFSFYNVEYKTFDEAVQAALKHYGIVPAKRAGPPDGA